MTHTPAVSSPQDPSSELARIASGAVEKGLAEYVKDVEYADALVKWLHVETGFNTLVLRLAVKAFAQLVGVAAAKAGSLSGSLVAKGLGRAYEAIPGHDRITAALGSAVERFSREQAAKGEFARMLGVGSADPNDLKQYLTLDLQAARASFEKLETIIDLLQPQPQLDIPLEPDTEENRFLFAARKVELMGRERHLAALGVFLSSDETFSWWLAAGPGGTGKSRLALEMCLRLGAGWRIGFFRGHRSFAWETWQPNQPTALIVDYANEEAERIGAMVDELRRRADNGDLALPVRVLLLVREAEGEWKRDFLGGQVRRARIERARHAEPLQVDPLGDEDLWAVVRSFIPERHTLPDRDATLTQLLEIDPQRRPLFASFAGDAIARGNELRGWDQQALVRDILERERRHWPDDDVSTTRRYENLLVLATITGGVDLRVVEQLNSVIFPSGVGEFVPDRYRAMSGNVATATLNPLLPDILGELYVLEHLSPERGADGRLVEEIRRSGWRHGPRGMTSFLTRTVQDFPFHPALRGLAVAAEEDGIQRLAWSSAAFNMITGYGKVGAVAEARTMYDALAKLSDAYPEDAAVRDRQAGSAFNLLVVYEECKAILEARAMYEALVRLSEAYPEDAAARRRRAKAAFNLRNTYSHGGEPMESLGLYEALVQLSVGYPGDAAVREIRAMATCNLVNDCRDAGQIGAAWGPYEDLVRLSEAYPGDAAVRAARSNAAGILIGACAGIGEIGEARRLYEALVRLSEVFPDDAAVREDRAIASNDMIAAYGDEGEITEARGLYEELVRLSAAHPEDSVVCQARAMAASNLMIDYGKRGEVEEVRKLNEALAQLPEACSGAAVVRGIQARAAFGLLNNYRQAGAFPEACGVYEAMVHLSEAYPEDAAVREQRAKAAVNIALDYGIAGEIGKARALCDGLVQLSEEYPEDGALRERRAKAVANLVSDYGNVGEMLEGRELYKALVQLSRVHPEDAAVREQGARAAFSLLYHSIKSDQQETAVRAYRDIVDLSTRYPDDPAVREVLHRVHEMFNFQGENVGRCGT